MLLRNLRKEYDCSPSSPGGTFQRRREPERRGLRPPNPSGVMRRRSIRDAISDQNKGPVIIKVKRTEGRMYSLES